jgi:hypothetical protein
MVELSLCWTEVWCLLRLVKNNNTSVLVVVQEQNKEVRLGQLLDLLVAPDAAINRNSKVMYGIH